MNYMIHPETHWHQAGTLRHANLTMHVTFLIGRYKTMQNSAKIDQLDIFTFHKCQSTNIFASTDDIG